jgi:UDP-N-acetylmuramyl tripeptide synthase
MNHSWRYRLAITSGLLTIKFLKMLNWSGANALPGLIAIKIDPSILSELCLNLQHKVIVTGTNGKTTTARLIGASLSDQKTPFIHNRTGSNLERGLVSALLNNYSKLNTDKNLWGIFEVDEAAFVRVLELVNPQYVIITNLFRDQLDRYGEVDTVLKGWIKALKNCQQLTLLLNANDPYLVYLAKQGRHKTYFYGLWKQSGTNEAPKHGSDALFCPNCLHPLTYLTVYLSHEGVFHCQKCRLKTPKPTVTVKNLVLHPTNSQLTLALGRQTIQIDHFLPGVYNIYNLLAAFTFLQIAKLPLTGFAKTANNFQPAFGRGEQFQFLGKQIQLLLIKNPTGLNEVIERLWLEPEKLYLLILINDKIADGRDVSWLWDADFEKLVSKTAGLYLSGSRCRDMALRAKIAGFSKPVVESQTKTALKKFLTLRQNRLFILPTYTALLDIKKELNRLGLTPKSWED